MPLPISRRLALAGLASPAVATASLGGQTLPLPGKGHAVAAGLFKKCLAAEWLKQLRQCLASETRHGAEGVCGARVELP